MQIDFTDILQGYFNGTGVILLLPEPMKHPWRKWVKKITWIPWRIIHNRPAHNATKSYMYYFIDTAGPIHELVNLTTIAPHNCLLPVRCQTIIWYNVGLLVIGPLGTNFSETGIRNHFYSRKFTVHAIDKRIHSLLLYILMWVIEKKISLFRRDPHQLI